MEIPKRENSPAERFLYQRIMNLPWSPCTKVQRDISVNDDFERAAKGSQLTRVVPPSFSVPFMGK